MRMDERATPDTSSGERGSFADADAFERGATSTRASSPPSAHAPDAPVSRTRRTDPPLSTREASLRGSRVLAVDDEPDAVELLALVLGQSGADVRTATSVAQAMAIIEEFDPHLVVSDISMPGEDGFDLLRRLRQLEAPYDSIPAIALTAFARREDVDASLRAGFACHMTKPADPRAVVRAAADALAAHRGRR